MVWILLTSVLWLKVLKIVCGETNLIALLLCVQPSEMHLAALGSNPGISDIHYCAATHTHSILIAVDVAARA
jgi:hypothetical protein